MEMLHGNAYGNAYGTVIWQSRKGGILFNDGK
jgi:hypothetical protein